MASDGGEREDLEMPRYDSGPWLPLSMNSRSETNRLIIPCLPFNVNAIPASGLRRGGENVESGAPRFEFAYLRVSVVPFYLFRRAGLTKSSSGSAARFAASAMIPFNVCMRSGSSFTPSRIRWSAIV